MRIDRNIQLQIERLLDWTADRYEKFVWECGNVYLYHYIKFEADTVISQIKRSETFWNWWKLHWEKRDRAFLDAIHGPMKSDIARQSYHILHDPAILAAELFPNGEVLGESYAAMIGEFNREVTA
jgi:hypothetical protein